jgi:hypothetical protein
MACAANLPLSESVGVGLGGAGLDWLADGHAEPLLAAVIAVAAGVAIVAARRLLKARDR